MRYARLVWALALGAVVLLAASEVDRATRLKQSLMAPCCWSESVAQHRSPLAEEMRAEIDRMVAAGKSDDEIVGKFKAQYGRRILTEPDGPAGAWLHWMPVALIAAGILWVVWLLRRWTRRAPATRTA